MENRPTQTSYVSVGEQRGVKRVWLQGLRLRDCGFDRGSRYRVEYHADDREIHLVASPDGKRTVSGRKRGETYDPILDVCNAEVTEFAGGVSRVRADFYNGRIVLTVSHLEAKREEREARFLGEVRRNQLTSGGLCCGIGMASQALSDGLSKSGLRSTVKWVVDRERKYLQVAADNAFDENTKLFEATLEELEPELLDPVAVLQVSLPCTGHSPAGKAKNKIKVAEEHKTDATAVVGLLNVVQAIQPCIVISENVVPARNSATFAIIKGALDSWGYNIHEIDLGPEHSGAIESRRRYWFVAVSRGIDRLDLGEFPRFKRRYETVGELLEAIPENDPSWSDNAYLKSKQIRDEAAGKGFANRQLLRPDATQMGTAGRGYQKRRSSEPFLSRDDGKERLFTPREICRAHGAPESLIEDVSAGPRTRD